MYSSPVVFPMSRTKVVTGAPGLERTVPPKKAWMVLGRQMRLIQIIQQENISKIQLFFE